MFEGKDRKSRDGSAALNTPPTPNAEMPIEPTHPHLKPSSDPICLGLAQMQKNTGTCQSLSGCFCLQANSWVLFKTLIFFFLTKPVTSNLKGDFKMVVIHGDLWTSPREFQKPGLSSHNSQEMQLKVSHWSLVQRVWTGSAGQSPGSLHPNTCVGQNPYRCYPRLCLFPSCLFPSVVGTSINLDKSYVSFPFLHITNL